MHETQPVSTQESHKKVRSILISQPKPERSPYYDLEKKYGLQIDWRQFIHVEPVTEKEFRKARLRPDEFSAVIFSSNHAIENYFRMCEEMRVKVSGDMKYFCLTQTIANYLQKFIVYRKRKVFVGSRRIEDLENALKKHKSKEKFLLPCSNLGSLPITSYLTSHGYDYQEAVMYKTVASDLSDLEDVTYDILVFFSPLGIESLFANFPDFKQNDTRLAIFGNSTAKAVEEKKLHIDIKVPAPGITSMAMGLEKYIQVANAS